MNIISGIGAIFLVLTILMMKESESKSVAYIGLGIIIVARLAAGSEGIEESTAVLLIVGIVSVVIAIQYYKAKRYKDIYDDIEKEITSLRAQEELERFQVNQELLLIYNEERNHSLALAEKEFNNKVERIKLLFDQNKISSENYEKSIKGIEEKYLETKNSLYGDV